MKIITPGQLKLYQGLKDFIDFDQGGLFCKKISLEYKAKSIQPWVVFNCKSDPRLSFQVHDLELKETDAAYWHLTAQSKKKITFNGFIHQLYHLGFGNLSGYMENKNESYQTGMSIRNGRVQRVRTQEELDENSLGLFSLIGYILETSAKKEKTKHKISPR